MTEQVDIPDAKTLERMKKCWEKNRISAAKRAEWLKTEEGKAYNLAKGMRYYHAHKEELNQKQRERYRQRTRAPSPEPAPAPEPPAPEPPAPEPPAPEPPAPEPPAPAPEPPAEPPAPEPPAPAEPPAPEPPAPARSVTPGRMVRFMDKDINLITTTRARSVGTSRPVTPMRIWGMKEPK